MFLNGKESIAANRERSDLVLERISRTIPSFITPNMITIVSLFLALLTAILIFSAGFYQSRVMIFTAGIFLALSSLLDALDGNLARIRNIESKSGDYLDHSLDRVADLFLILSIGFGGFVSWFIVALAIGGISLTSNFGALSKTVGLSRNYGGFGRVWRLFIMIIVLLFSSVLWNEIGVIIKFTLLGWMTVMFAIGGYYTAIVRFFDTQKKLKKL